VTDNYVLYIIGIKLPIYPKTANLLEIKQAIRSLLQPKLSRLFEEVFYRVAQPAQLALM